MNRLIVLHAQTPHEFLSSSVASLWPPETAGCVLLRVYLVKEMLDLDERIC